MTTEESPLKMGEEFLDHHGIKGQKWGIRKQRSGAEQKRIDSRKKIASKRRSLSDDDIKKYIDRLSNEKKLKEMINEDVAPGKTVAKRILGDSGQKVARTVIAGAALYAIKVGIERKFSAGDAANFITPRPKSK